MKKLKDFNIIFLNNFWYKTKYKYFLLSTYI